MGFGHAETVENISTACKPFPREGLYGLIWAEPLHSSAMTVTLEKRLVGDRLRLAREALGFGLREFARMYKDDHTKLFNWEKGKNYPDLRYVRWLWDNHAINADWIYLGRVSGLPYELAVSLQAAERALEEASKARPDRASDPGTTD
jgi:transcriptional regulator with XRE-family HTH domain